MRVRFGEVRKLGGDQDGLKVVYTLIPLNREISRLVGLCLRFPVGFAQLKYNLELKLSHKSSPSGLSSIQKGLGSNILQVVVISIDSEVGTM